MGGCKGARVGAGSGTWVHLSPFAVAGEERGCRAIASRRHKEKGITESISAAAHGRSCCPRTSPETAPTGEKASR